MTKKQKENVSVREGSLEFICKFLMLILDGNIEKIIWEELMCLGSFSVIILSILYEKVEKTCKRQSID